jgi:hypothetical protein
VGEKAHLMNLPCHFRKFQQGFISWTADALRIGKILVDDSFKRFKQFLLRTHSAIPARRWSPNPLAVVPLGESHESRPVSMKIFACIDAAPLIAVLA